MNTPPLPCVWDGDCFSPLDRFRRLADKHFVVGQIYPLVVEEQRSSASHRHYFACVNEAWQNLPDSMATAFPTAELLRKTALIETGWYNERRLIASSPAEARKIAAFMQAGDEYAVISVSGCAVIERTAKTQSVRGMPNGDFKQSKQDVLDYLANLIGVTPEALASNADRAA